ncbi:MAG: hypothetical protein QM709_01900 [Spongiibacteraceae bacterium]
MLALIGSACLSLWVWIGGTSINTDGVIYLDTAAAYNSHGLTAATQIYNLPFYPILIAYVAKLGFSLEAAAHTLNLIFFAIISFTFVSITEALYPHSKRIHYLAVAIILFLPRINFMRESFFRDNGHLAFMLLSLLAIINFSRNQKPLLLAAWAISITLSAFFRPEAALFFLAGPAMLLWSNASQKRYLPALLLIIGGAAAGILFLSQTQSIDHHSPLFWLRYYTTDFITEFNKSTNVIAASALSEFSKDYAQEGLIAIFITVLIGTIINTLTPVYSVVLWLARNTRAGLADIDKKISICYCLCAIVAPILFILKYRFLTSRYVLAFSLLALLFVPPKLISLIEKIRPSARRSIVIGIISLFFVVKNLRELTIDSIQRDAGLWLSHTPGSVFTNNLAISFYAKSADNSKAVQVDDNENWLEHSEKLAQYDRLALLVNRKEAKELPLLIEKIHGVEEKRFEQSNRVIVVIRNSKEAGGIRGDNH